MQLRMEQNFIIWKNPARQNILIWTNQGNFFKSALD